MFKTCHCEAKIPPRGVYLWGNLAGRRCRWRWGKQASKIAHSGL